MTPRNNMDDQLRRMERTKSGPSLLVSSPSVPDHKRQKFKPATPGDATSRAHSASDIRKQAIVGSSALKPPSDHGISSRSASTGNLTSRPSTSMGSPFRREKRSSSDFLDSSLGGSAPKRPKVEPNTQGDANEDSMDDTQEFYSFDSEISVNTASTTLYASSSKSDSFVKPSDPDPRSLANKSVLELHELLMNYFNQLVSHQDTIVSQAFGGEKRVDEHLFNKLRANINEEIEAVKKEIASRPILPTSREASSWPVQEQVSSTHNSTEYPPAMPPSRQPSLRSTAVDSLVLHETSYKRESSAPLNDAKSLKAKTIDDDDDELWGSLEDPTVDAATDHIKPVNSPRSPALVNIGNIIIPSSPQPSLLLRSPQRPPTSFRKDICELDDSREPSYIERTRSSHYPEIMRILKRTFKLNSFRENQFEAIDATLSGKDVFVLMPTGGGKSLCYQLPALCKGGITQGVTVVVSPLKALMTDQVQHLEELGVDVASYNGDNDNSVTMATNQRLRSSRKPALLYTTPEKLQLSGQTQGILQQLWEQKQLARFVVDEAHCISSWGRSFRQSYVSLDQLRKDYSGVPIMALTATANKTVVEDIINKLGMTDCTRLTMSFNRPNLRYYVIPKPSAKVLLNDISTWINENHPHQSGVIYCFSRNDCESVANELHEKYGLEAAFYHAGMRPADKERTQAKWQRGECHIMVATIAFGMGIDKPDVRFVIHHSMPKDLASYYQETGRAGRDGEQADCLFYYSYADVRKRERLIDKDDPDSPSLPREEKQRQKDDLRDVMRYAINVTDCRRCYVLQFFGQKFDRNLCHDGCDNCLFNRDAVEENMADIAVHLITLVRGARSQNLNITTKECIAIYRGADTKTIKHKGGYGVLNYGKGRGTDPALIERVLYHLLTELMLDNYMVGNAGGWSTEYLQLGPNAQSVLNGDPVMMARHRVLPGKNGTKGAGKKKTKKPESRNSTWHSDAETSTVEVISTSVTVQTTRQGRSTKPVSRLGEGVRIQFDSDEDYVPDEEEEEIVEDDVEEIISDDRPIRMHRREEVEEISDDDDPAIIAAPSGVYNDEPYKHLKLLQDFRDEHASNRKDLEQLSDDFLWNLATLLPKDMRELNNIVKDSFTEYDATRVYSKFGKGLLNVCVGIATKKKSAAAARPPRSSSKTIDATKFSHQPSTSSSSPSIGPKQPIAKSSKFTPARIIRPMP